MRNENVSSVIVGVGNVGQSHLKAYQSNPLIDVQGLVDLDIEQAQQLANEHGIPQVETELKDVLQEQSIDAVSIATPEKHHLEPTRTALDADCCALLEKPMAANLDEAAEIVELAEESDGFLTIGYMRRFVPEFAQLKERLDAGDFGDLLGIKASHVGRMAAYDHAADWSNPMYYMGVHEIDLLRWLVDSEIEWVFASESGGLNGNDTPAVIASQLGFTDGTVGMLETSWGRHNGYPNISTTSIQATGTSGYANVSTEQDNAVVSTEAGTEYLEPWKYHGTLHGRKHDMYAWEIDHFVRCVRQEQTPLVTPEDGYASLKVANAIIESYENHEVIPL